MGINRLVNPNGEARRDEFLAGCAAFSPFKSCVPASLPLLRERPRLAQRRRAAAAPRLRGIGDVRVALRGGGEKLPPPPQRLGRPVAGPVRDGRQRLGRLHRGSLSARLPLSLSLSPSPSLSSWSPAARRERQPFSKAARPWASAHSAAEA